MGVSPRGQGRDTETEQQPLGLLRTAAHGTGASTRGDVLLEEAEVRVNHRSGR